ncbi:hypothetical protein Syn7502_02088 [Synechococcus sp. PCC 7502]|uniref:hypothetical protein n=1 Tax=Synechococcus sp. PCC 7502 TaxID=1173263 RepID=UPI00029FDAA0|nr:hypothetical protein [Synechococcus sp. PCC 7502]AFY74107.1 hypothetical protein Syn7502_02088 [Synechococcus sp. PCC 7502]
MNAKLIQLFRKFHRLIAIIIAIPFTLIVLTGMAVTIEEQWQFLDIHLSRGFLLDLHTGAIFNLQAFYPILSGLGLIGLLVSGISLTGIFRRNPKKS